MAVTIISQPAEDVAVGKGLRWEISLSAPSNPDTIKRKLVYRLIRVTTGLPVTPDEQVSYTGQNIVLDFANDVAKFLPGFRPQLNVVYNGADFQYAAFRLEYAEVDFDITTCDEIGDITFTSSGNKRVWNIYPATGEYPVANIATIGFMMTYKPAEVIGMARDQRDFLFFCPGDLGIDLVLRQYDLTGALIQTNGFGYNGGIKTINVFGLSGNNTGGVADVNNLSKMEIDITGRPSDTPIAKYIVEFYDACHGQEFRELYFVEPLGGVSSIRFDESTFNPVRQSIVAGEEIQGTEISNEGFRTGGLKSVNSSSYKSITLRKYFEAREEWSKFYEGFQASRFIWIAQKDQDGNVQMANFIVGNTSIESKNDGSDGLLVVTGRLHKNIATLKNYDD